jgi:hypothetical protein
MYAVIRKFDSMRSVEEAGRRAVAGLGPALTSAPGFRGYYIVDAGNNTGLSVTLFDTRESAQKAHENALGWIRQNLGDLTGGEPTIYAGNVVGSVVPDSAEKNAAA